MRSKEWIRSPDSLHAHLEPHAATFPSSLNIANQDDLDRFPRVEFISLPRVHRRRSFSIQVQLQTNSPGKSKSPPPLSHSTPPSSSLLPSIPLPLLPFSLSQLRFASFLRLRLRLPRLMESLRVTQAFQIARSSKPTVARVRIGPLAIRYPPRTDRGFFLSLRTCCVKGRNVDGARIPDGSSPDPEAEIVNDASAPGIGQVLYTGILSPHYTPCLAHGCEKRFRSDTVTYRLKPLHAYRS